jgi:hypothetical protein
VPAWCGSCGQGFGLDEVVRSSAAGSCPRCGVSLAPGYAPVAVPAVHELLRAVDGLLAAGRRLRDVAPLLHVDAAALHEQVRGVLEGRRG